jgi:hypothetical protein
MSSPDAHKSHLRKKRSGNPTRVNRDVIIPIGPTGSAESSLPVSSSIGPTGSTDPTNGPTGPTGGNDDIVVPIPTVSTDPDTGAKMYNNWSQKNLTTLKEWKTTIAKSSFIYDTVNQKYDTRLKRFLLIAFIINGVSTLISTISAAVLGINPALTTVGFWLSVVIAIVQLGGTIVTGAVKIYGWDTLVKNISVYIQKLDSFYATISSELILSDMLREDANKFIIKQNEQFTQIIQSQPVIYPTDYDKALVKFDEFIKDNDTNYKCAQKYDYKENVDDVV